MARSSGPDPSSRWSVVRLLAHRNRNATMECALVHRQTDGRHVFDRRLRWGQVELSPNSLASADPIWAAFEALCEVMSARELEYGAEVMRARALARSAPPGGPRGDPTP